MKFTDRKEAVQFLIDEYDRLMEWFCTEVVDENLDIRPTHENVQRMQNEIMKLETEIRNLRTLTTKPCNT